MKNSILFWLRLAERFVAGVVLVTLMPSLLIIAFLIYAASGQPVMLCDEFPNDAGGIARRLRFRTAGPGNPFFRALGRLLRRYSIDELPALWSVARGDIRFLEISDTRRSPESTP